MVTFKKPNPIYRINEHSAAISYKIVADVYDRPHCVAKLILGIFCKACRALIREREEKSSFQLSRVNLACVGGASSYTPNCDSFNLQRGGALTASYRSLSKPLQYLREPTQAEQLPPFYLSKSFFSVVLVAGKKDKFNTM